MPKIKTGVFCGSFGLLSKDLEELDSMIKDRQIPPAFTLLRRDGRRVDVNNNEVKFDLINGIFKHSYLFPDFVVVIEGSFPDYRVHGHHNLTNDQVGFLAKLSNLPIDIIPAKDIKNYKLNICEEAEDILINRSLEEFALRNLEYQIKREFAHGMRAAEPQYEPDIMSRLVALMNQVGINPELLTEEQVQLLYHTLEDENANG